MVPEEVFGSGVNKNPSVLRGSLSNDASNSRIVEVKEVFFE
jgi:hypothetical protein